MARNLAFELREACDDALSAYDVLVMPTLPYTAAPLLPPDAPLEHYLPTALGMIGNCAPFDVTGHPACTVPAGLVDGLPSGLMIIGKHFDDATELPVADTFEQAIGGSRRLPQRLWGVPGERSARPRRPRRAGSVEIPENEPAFRAEWEKAAFAMFSMCFRGGFFGVDSFRYGVEQMHLAVYLLSPYYEHWAHAVEHYRVAKGVLDEAEIEKLTQFFLENPDARMPEREDADLLAFVDGVVKAGAPAGRPSDKGRAVRGR